jgi:hypothetical protein
MKSLKFAIALVLFFVSGFYCSAQYGKDDLQPGVNNNINANTWNPTQDVRYSVDSNEVNHVDFGEKSNKTSFKVVFPIKSIDADSPSLVSFKKSEIMGTNITRNSGISSIELTHEGFEVTYNTRKKTGPVDDYIVISTFNGRFMLRLTGNIIAQERKKAK